MKLLLFTLAAVAVLGVIFREDISQQFIEDSSRNPTGVMQSIDNLGGSVGQSLPSLGQ